MHIFDARTARVLATICLFAAVAAFIYGVRHTLVIFLFAIFFAYLLEPLVVRIERSPIGRGSRGLAIAETYVLVGALLATLVIIFGPRLAEETRNLAKALPALLEKVASGKIIWQLGRHRGWSYETQLRIQQLIASHRQQILAWMAGLGRQVASSLTNVIWVLLVPILAVFFLSEGSRFAQAFVNTSDGRDQRRLLRGIVEDLDQVLARFIFTQILLATFSFGAYLIVLSLLRYPYTVPLAVAGGLTEFIPVVGPLVAAATILGVGVLSGFSLVWVVFIFLGVWRVCQDYIISPRVMGRGVQLHPLAAIAAVLMGGELGGVLGVYLSIPIAATIRVIWNRLQLQSHPASDQERLRPVPAPPPRESTRG